MEITRRKSRVVKVGSVLIGGRNPVVIQSMTKTRTSDADSSVRQIRRLEEAGCQVVRLAINDFNDALALRKIKPRVNLPLVADIHFDWRLAVAAIENGADKIRLNPGNIYKKHEIEQVISALKSARVPLRIGLNSGSVRNGKGAKLTMGERLVSSCLDYVKIVERLKFDNIVISLKANNVLDTLEAYRKIPASCDYPLHLGLTATGSVYEGLIKSSVTLGALLLEGIGDTIRVSLTEDPAEEVRAAKGILEALGLRNFGPQIISCPTCGRCRVNLVEIVKKLEKGLSGPGSVNYRRPVKVAVMGCVVNGPGEAREADIGVAFGRGQGVFFKRGKITGKIAAKDCVRVILGELKTKEKTWLSKH